jgi:hypothetical protein
MLVMGQEPLPNMSAEEVRAFFADKHTQEDLADAFAVASNKFWWVEDNVYDYEQGTPEHKEACALTDEWRDLMNEYLTRIFEILTSEGVAIPETGQITVLEPFMQRFGYIDGNGWWIKEQKSGVISLRFFMCAGLR